jgi:ankyrin repeat protein
LVPFAELADASMSTILPNLGSKLVFHYNMLANKKLYTQRKLMIKKLFLLALYATANCYGMEERLLDAFKQDDVDAMRKLIVEEKADPNSFKSKKQQSLLHFAVLCEKGKFVDLLAQHGADLSAGDSAGWAPIHLAAAANKAKFVTQLLKYDPKKQLSLRNANGETPLLLALRSGSQEAAQVLYANGGTEALENL